MFKVRTLQVELEFTTNILTQGAQRLFGGAGCVGRSRCFASWKFRS